MTLAAGGTAPTIMITGMNEGRTNEKGITAMKRPRRPDARRGFSLVELLIVIVILLALGSIVAVTYLNVADKAEVDLQRVQLDQVDEAMKLFKLDMKRWPTEDEGLAALWSVDVLEDEEDQARWRGPYLESPIREDKWGSELVYHNPSVEMGDGSYDVISFGPDREEDTEDDITNHDNLRNADGEIDDTFDDFNPGG